MLTWLKKLGYSFVQDESGQDTLEYAAALACAAALVLFAYDNIGYVEIGIASAMNTVQNYLKSIQ
jgi:hypothetical protein